MRICTVQEMRELDRRAMETCGLSEEVLMENAGHAVCEAAKREFGTTDRRYVVVAGAGNNGGDGLVAARLLHSCGADVRVDLLADDSAFHGTARTNLEAALRCGVNVRRLHAVDELYLGRSSDVVIDAIFGTGLSRAPEGLHADVIECLNKSALSILSVDIPSGVDGDTGATPGIAVKAACTVTFGLPKRGNVLPPGRELCGRIFVSRISFPPWLCDSTGEVVTGELAPLPARALESHKRSYGDVLFVAGAQTYLGAPFLVAMSFLKAGGGYARLAVPKSLAPALGVQACEVVMVPQPETKDGSMALSSLDSLCALSEQVDMVVVGPGVSLNQETQEMVRRFVSQLAVPVLVDGDGLTAVAAEPACVRGRKAPTVLTPHAGEMARLLRSTASQVEQDRVGAVQQAAREFGAVVVLKGSSTLVARVDERVSLNLSGNPGMATAGCGDVLAGSIAAMYGAGLEIRCAAEVGAFVHGIAGDLAAEAGGQDGLIARDVMAYLPAAVRLYRESFRELMRNHYTRLNVI